MATSTFYGNLQYYLCIPTENDHYGSGYGGVGAGMIPQEKTFNPLIAAQSPVEGHVVSGFAPPSSGSFSSPYVVGTVTAGEAIIEGYRIVGESTISVNFTASTTNYLFLKLEYDANSRVYRPVLHVDDTSYTRPTSSIPLGEVTTDASSITGTVDLRPQNKMLYGTADNTGGDAGDIIKRGSDGWSFSRTGTGTCTLTFSPVFLTAPVVIVTPTSAAYAAVSSVTTSGATVTTYDDAGSATDADWSFIAYS